MYIKNKIEKKENFIEPMICISDNVYYTSSFLLNDWLDIFKIN